MKNPFERILSIGVPLSWGVLRYNFFRLFKYRTFIIYTMGKVGSTSIYEALKKAGGKQPLVYHVHFLSANQIKRITGKYLSAGNPEIKRVPLRSIWKNNLDHLVSSRILSDVKIKQNSILISLVRDPIDTYLSHIFQNPRVHRPELLDENGMISREKVQDYINNNMGSYRPEEDFIANWFKTEFEVYTGFNVYDQPFDHTNGVLVAKNSKFDILIFDLRKVEKMINPSLEGLMNEKLNVEVGRKNVRSVSTEGALYSEIKKSIVFDKKYLEKVYSTQYAMHFFDEEYRKEKINFWSVPRR